MQVHSTTTKSEAMTHIKSMMKTALTGTASDRVVFAELNEHYRAIDSLNGETVEELFHGVSTEAHKSRKASEIFDVLGSAGLVAMILGMCLAGISTLGLALGVILVGSGCFLVGGFASAITGSIAEEKERLIDHLEWLCDRLVTCPRSAA